jgi:hypothetical protein
MAPQSVFPLYRRVTQSWVELTGFEPGAPSLRKMRSKRSDQGKRHVFTVLWRGCGTSDVRHRETGGVGGVRPLDMSGYLPAYVKGY